MAEKINENSGRQRSGANAEARPSRPLRSSSFKYYIHDRVESCRLEIIGELSEAEVTELDGCWRTARTTLGTRTVVLDLRAVRSVDDAGKRWLSSMASEGAVCVPECFLRDALAGKPCPEPQPAKPPVKVGLLGRLLAIFGAADATAD